MATLTLKQIIKKAISPLIKTEANKSDLEKLREIASIECNSEKLGKITEVKLTQYFHSETITNFWNSVKDSIDNLNLPDMTGGVNPGDQRAIFYLICALKPEKVLEIGTHIGCSTVHIALALKQLIQNEANDCNRKFLTVDIRDVNDRITKPWQEFNSSASPLELISQMNCQTFTQFKMSPSLDFLNESLEKFDFIFLDGLHDAYMVYQEIPVALTRLNSGGFILLHDYFPKEQALWEGQPPITGPYLAVKRLLEEGADFKVIPLGDLPWATKLGTNKTSLALVTK